ncbi:MAG TPA: hypothetical protein VIL29_08080 [Pseudothermotoga sp.]
MRQNEFSIPKYHQKRKNADLIQTHSCKGTLGSSFKEDNPDKQNEILLQRILSEANSKSKKELERLEKEKVILNLRISQVKAKGKVLVDKLLEMGEEYSRFIKEEMKEAEEELKELEEQLSEIKTKIEQSRNYLINKEMVREGFRYFNKILMT